MGALHQGRRMFTWGDTVIVTSDAPAHMRPGSLASVVGVTSPQERRGSHFEQFPAGTIYLVEFGDGEALDIHENMLKIPES